jgi:type VI protein secretion system component Hcp
MWIYVDFGDPIGDYCLATSFSFSTSVPRVAGGPAYVSQRNDVQFSKDPDSLSHDIFVNCASGTVFPSITIEVWFTEKACTLMFTMTNAVISTYQSSKSVESVSLNYESISYRRF